VKSPPGSPGPSPKGPVSPGGLRERIRLPPQPQPTAEGKARVVADLHTEAVELTNSHLDEHACMEVRRREGGAGLLNRHPLAHSIQSGLFGV
jgi:hypothetical protein